MEFSRIGASFMRHLFDRAAVTEQAARIVAGILAARSPRLPEVEQRLPGTLLFGHVERGWGALRA